MGLFGGCRTGLCSQGGFLTRGSRLPHPPALHQVITALAEGRTDPTHSELRDVRLRKAVTAVRLLPGGDGVEVDVAGEVSAGPGPVEG